MRMVMGMKKEVLRYCGMVKDSSITIVLLSVSFLELVNREPGTGNREL